jgi:hypothetical protein
VSPLVSIQATKAAQSFISDLHRIQDLVRDIANPLNTKKEKWYRSSRTSLTENIEGKIRECNQVLDSSVELFKVDLYPKYQDGSDIDIQDGVDRVLDSLSGVRYCFLFICDIAIQTNI